MPIAVASHCTVKNVPGSWGCCCLGTAVGMLYIQESMGHALMVTKQLCCRTGFAPARGGLQDPPQWIYPPPPSNLPIPAPQHCLCVCRGPWCIRSPVKVINTLWWWFSSAFLESWKKSKNMSVQRWLLYIPEDSFCPDDWQMCLRPCKHHTWELVYKIPEGKNPDVRPKKQ